MFLLDDRINATCFFLGDWPLSMVLLKNEKAYPWLMLVPRKEGIEEIIQLSSEEQQILMEEITTLSSLMKAYFKVDKLNIASLGNVVSQLHIHIVGRCRSDPLWPHGIWQSAYQPSGYDAQEAEVLTKQLSELVKK